MIERYKPIKTNYFNNTKIVNRFHTLDDLKKQIQVGELGDNKEVFTYIDFKSSDMGLLNTTISQFEIVVMDAIYTLSLHGRRVFTADMVANVIAGKEVGNNKDKSTRFNDITKAIEKLLSMRIKIDFSEIARELDFKDIPDIETKVSDYMLPLMEITIKSKVKKIDKTCYVLKNTPILYRYAEYMGRVVSVPSSLLAIPDSREDILFTILKRELIKEISLMKNKKNNYKSRTITYEWNDGEIRRGLFERIGLRKEDYANDGQWRKKKSKVNTMIKQIMTHLINEKYIKGFSFNKSSGAIVGFDVQI